MKKLLLLLLASLLVLSGCTEAPTYIDGIAIVYKDNRPYLIDLEGNRFSLAKYDSIVGEMNEIIIVKKSNKFGYILHTGEEIVAPIYDMAMPFSEGLALVKRNNRFQVINTVGTTVFELPHGIESFSKFQDGLLLSTMEGKYGYLDTNGNVAIDFEYDDADLFYEGKAVVGINVDGTIKYGYIEFNNNPITGFDYIAASRYQNGYAAVAKTKNSSGYPLYGYIDEFGEEVIAFQYAYAYPFSDGLAVVANYITRVAGRNTYTFKDYRYIDVAGNVVINPNVHFVGIFYGNFIPGNFQHGISRFFFNSWGIYDKDMNQILRPRYMEMSEFKNGLAVVRAYPALYGMINESGEVIIPLEFERIIY